MKTRSIGQRMLSLLLSLALLLTWIPWSAMSAYAEPVLNVVEDSKKADPSTIDNWTNYFGPDKMDTEFAGAVWTDKSVYTAATNDLPGVTLDGENNFLVALSAIASNLSITGHTASPTDTMLVLDLSGSMVDGTYEVGTVRRNNNNYQTVNGIDMSLIDAMIEATNDTIDQLMKQNSNNRVGVVLYSGNTDSGEAATPSTATVVLPLGRYTGVDSEYLSVDATRTTATLYTWRSSGWFGGSWEESGEATYVAAGTNVSVSVKDGLKTETGGDVTDRSKRAEGGTYIQNGLYQAMNQFLNVSDTTVPEGRPQAGAERMPVLVLMTDGAPTIATNSYNNIGDSNEGNGTSTTDRITFLTQLTAAYVRGQIAAKYQESASDDKEMLLLTLGLGTENSSAATNTLYPVGSNNTLVDYWNRYLAGSPGSNVQVTTGNNGWSVYRDAAVEAMNYVDKYFYASNAEGLLESFSDIISEIELKAGSYTTLVESVGANFSGYTSFEDGLGEMMHVLDVKGIFMGDKNGNKVLYTGKGVAESMNAGNLGTVDSPNERGDELVRTVKERIPGLTTTQAQQLIGHAYSDQQLYYVDDNNWSNYIGWYANADGEYIGFWDKDSGFENAPKDPQDPKKTAVYANRSYGYLGVDNENESDMMHVRVMVTTELETLEQTVSFQIPASLLPTVQYHVTLEEDDPNGVKEFTCDEAIPMQLVFEVGLRPDINSVNLEQKLAEHRAAGGHFHRDPVTGEVIFYTNEFSKGNDTNQNGIPDPDEVDDAVVTQSHFHPALDNTRYYYTENTKIYTTGDDLVTSQTRPTGEGYYYHRYIYSANGRQIINTPIAETTLENDAQYDAQSGYWYIPAGTMYHNLQRFRLDKDVPAQERIGLGYSFFPAVFDSVGKQDVYTFLGNNGTFRLTPATGITLRKELQAAVDADTFTFRVTMTGVPVGKVAAPVITDANGDPLANVTMSQVQNGQFNVTMPANVTAYISGIPVGTTVTVEEQIFGDYQVVGIQVAGQNQMAGGPATAVVPAYTANGTQMVPVVITNAPNLYGDLVISKDIVHNLTSDPQAMATKEFTFRVKLEGSQIQAGNTFETDETGKKVKVGSDGYLTYEDGTLIKLKNEESITIYDIPQGTAYTVTEDALPGFRLDNIGGDQNSSAATGAIVADTEVLADFYNRYPDQFDSVEVPVTLNVSKILNELSTYNGNEQFRFALQMLLPNNTYPSIEDNNGAEYVAVEANDTASGVYTLPFDQLGTYFFRVVELEPSPKTLGMTYSTMQALFRVEVTDADMDGTLEIAVLEEANLESIVATYDDNDPEKITGITVAAEFTNIYEVGSVSTTLNVHKELTNPANAPKPLTDFHFTMYPSDAQGNVADDAQGTTVTSSALGDATFNLVLDEAGTFYYKVVESIPAEAVLNTQTGKYELNGMAYDPAQYLFTVTTQVNAAAELEITQRTLMELTTGTPVAEDSEGKLIAQFTNVYTLTPTDIFIPVVKTLTGRNPEQNETFETLLVRTDGAFHELTGEDAWNASYYLSAGVPSNVKLSFEKVGTYHYKWTEVVPDGAVKNAVTGLWEKDGITYDPAEYHITVTVTDGGNGKLAASYVIHNVGHIAEVDSVDFVNTYTVTGSDTVTIGGKKVLSGRILYPGEFSVGLYSDSACTDLIESAANRADGTFAFSTRTFTANELGENNAQKTYTYYVKEIIPAGAQRNAEDKLEYKGVAYDETVHTVTVEVSHENGALVVTPSANYATLQISNTYKAESVEVTLGGSKVLSGNWDAVVNKSFTFQLFEADASFTITNNTPVKTATVNGANSFEMKLNYADGTEGFHYFVLKEDISHRAGGISYDAGEYHITVNVTDPGDGKLVAFVTKYRPGTGNTETAVFTNIYSAEPAKATLVGEKSFTNTTNNQPMAMAEDRFSFVILEVSDPNATDLTNAAFVGAAYNKEDGTITFPEITYNNAGVHYYKVVEIPGEDDFVEYDDTVFDVTVTVTDDGQGKLSAVVDYNGEDILFENTYTPEAAQVTIGGTKVLEGDWTAVENKTFVFELYETGADFAITGTPVTASNGSDGSFTFPAKVYEAAGTHYYVLKERPGTADKGITYAQNTVQITVVVTDDAQGNLIPTVTTNDTNAVITTDAQNSRVVTVSGLSFTNKYEAKPAKYLPEAQKRYDSVAGQMEEFTFVLSVDGDDKQTKKNDADGKVLFEELTFSAVGTYEVKIREKIDLLWGLIRWDKNVYTVTLHVEDDGEGQLFVNENKTTVTSDKGDDDILFRNAHHDVIVDKDVFRPAAPTVSVDGKVVEKGEILTYQISYKNFDSVKVDVEITDTISQYAEYVEGSASHQGTYANGTLTWLVKDVAPGETVTVSFHVKVTASQGQLVENQATLKEDGNTYTTKTVKNPVKEDEVNKDVFHTAAPAVSINGKTVKKGDVLRYTVTYKNSDDFPAEVTLTDKLSQYLSYKAGSADNGGTYADGIVTWKVKLDAGKSVTVSFEAEVIAENVTVENQVVAVEDGNTHKTNVVTTGVEKPAEPTPPAPTVPTTPNVTPDTGDNSQPMLFAAMMLVSAAAVTFLLLGGKKKETAEK